MEPVRIMHCREIATLLDSDQVPSLSFVNRVQVRVHLWVCWHCRLFLKQIAWLRKIAVEHPVDDADADFESRILRRL